MKIIFDQRRGNVETTIWQVFDKLEDAKGDCVLTWDSWIGEWSDHSFENYEDEHEIKEEIANGGFVGNIIGEIEEDIFPDNFQFCRVYDVSFPNGIELCIPHNQQNFSYND